MHRLVVERPMVQQTVAQAVTNPVCENYQEQIITPQSLTPLSIRNKTATQTMSPDLASSKVQENPQIRSKRVNQSSRAHGLESIQYLPNKQNRCHCFSCCSYYLLTTAPFSRTFFLFGSCTAFTMMAMLHPSQMCFARRAASATQS